MGIVNRRPIQNSPTEFKTGFAASYSVQNFIRITQFSHTKYRILPHSLKLVLLPHILSKISSKIRNFSTQNTEFYHTVSNWLLSSHSVQNFTPILFIPELREARKILHHPNCWLHYNSILPKKEGSRT